MFKTISTLIIMSLLLSACGNKPTLTQQPSKQESKETTQQSKQSPKHEHIRDDMYQDASLLYKVLINKSEQNHQLQEIDMNSLVDFGKKYSKDSLKDMTPEELQLRDSILAMGQAIADKSLAITKSDDKAKQDAINMFNEHSSKAKKILVIQ